MEQNFIIGEALTLNDWVIGHTSNGLDCISQVGALSTIDNDWEIKSTLEENLYSVKGIPFTEKILEKTLLNNGFSKKIEDKDTTREKIVYSKYLYYKDYNDYSGMSIKFWKPEFRSHYVAEGYINLTDKKGDRHESNSPETVHEFQHYLRSIGGEYLDFANNFVIEQADIDVSEIKNYYYRKNYKKINIAETCKKLESICSSYICAGSPVIDEIIDNFKKSLEE